MEINNENLIAEITKCLQRTSREIISFPKEGNDIVCLSNGRVIDCIYIGYDGLLSVPEVYVDTHSATMRYPLYKEPLHIIQKVLEYAQTYQE